MVDLVNTPEPGDAGEVTEPVSDLPENLRDKSAVEIAQMYQNLERKLGQQSEELGSLRQLADQMLTQQKPKEEPADLDFYDDPIGTISKLIDQKVSPLYAERTQAQQQAAKQRLDAEVPGWQDTLKTEEFQNWVAGSAVRKDLFLRGNAGEFDAAKELFQTYGDLNTSKAKTEEATKSAVTRDRKKRAAMTEKGSASIDPRKILSRADLRNLRQTNPTRYNELMPDIKKAYQEGRVK